MGSSIPFEVSLALTLLTIFILIGAYFFTLKGKPPAEANSSDDDDDSSVTIEITEEKSLESYPKLVFSEAKIEKGATTTCCSICLEDYEEKDMVRIIPECEHLFHIKCVDPWLKKNSSCPICRKINDNDQKEALQGNRRQFLTRSAYSHSSRFLIKRDNPLFTQTNNKNNTTNHDLNSRRGRSIAPKSLDTRNSTAERSVSRSAPTDAAAVVSVTTDATARRVCYDGCSRSPCPLRRMQPLAVAAPTDAAARRGRSVSRDSVSRRQFVYSDVDDHDHQSCDDNNSHLYLIKHVNSSIL
ncbi:hypothetical protein ACFE04_001449 [Oxalis oulophora]